MSKCNHNVFVSIVYYLLVRPSSGEQSEHLKTFLPNKCFWLAQLVVGDAVVCGIPVGAT